MAPARLLPDTCAWIDFFRGRQTQMGELLANSLPRIEVFSCGVVLYELLQGIKSKQEEKLLNDAFQALSHLEMTRELWIKAGQLSSQLRGNGQTLPFSDIIIATLALEHRCAVVTIDRHFEAIPGLVVVGELP